MGLSQRRLKFTLNMLSRRMLTVIALVSVTTVIFLLCSRRLDKNWAADGSYYRPLMGKGSRALPGKTPGGRAQAPLAGQQEDAAHQNVSNPDIPNRPYDPICDSFPDTSNILLIMKTGATESFNKVPTQLMTMLKCLPEYFIFSDLDETVADYHIRDALDKVLPEAMEGNGDFDLYRRQKACAADQQSCGGLAEHDNEGWNLDKYKNVHIAEKTYHLRPNYDWYVYVDADTFVLWNNLVQWLKNLNPKNKHYLGSVTSINNFNFGHGGSGYIVSQAAMHDMVANNQNVGNQWDLRASKECCGDYIFSMAIYEAAGVPVHNVWPTINGEKPFTLPYGPRHWCHPIVTMHHMNAQEISMFWEFEHKRYADPDMPQPPPILRIKDIYDQFFRPRLVPERSDWDNFANDQVLADPSTEDKELRERSKKDNLNQVEQDAHRSFGHCRAACEASDDCFSYRYKGGGCYFSWSFTLGRPVRKESEEEKRMMSGWDVRKINAWIEEQGACGPVEWPYV